MIPAFFFRGDPSAFSLPKPFANRVLDPSLATSCPQPLNPLSWWRGRQEHGEAYGCSALPFLGASLKNLSTSKPQPTAVLMPSTTRLKLLCTSAHTHTPPHAHTSLLPLLPPWECHWHHAQPAGRGYGRMGLPSRFSHHVDPGSCCVRPPSALPHPTPGPFCKHCCCRNAPAPWWLWGAKPQAKTSARPRGQHHPWMSHASLRAKPAPA